MSIEVKAATVEICYRTSEYWFRCGECGSLNVVEYTDSLFCPDCGQECAVPKIELCDCKEE